ncbi:MAG: hypothetical protein H7144_14885 [Burkholderiales bacterium]|nr:hypothetical protein [Phycisphaerae bacterium]
MSGTQPIKPQRHGDRVVEQIIHSATRLKKHGNRARTEKSQQPQGLANATFIGSGNKERSPRPTVAADSIRK